MTRMEARRLIVDTAEGLRRSKLGRHIRATYPYSMRRLQRAVSVVRQHLAVPEEVLITAGFRPTRRKR